MADNIKFPTSVQAAPGSYEAEIIDVRHDLAPAELRKLPHFDDEETGLHIKQRFASGKEREIFYKNPPAGRTNQLIKAIKELGIDLDAIQWEGLIGMKFRWVREKIPFEVWDKDKGERITRPTECEYPIELISGTQASPAPAPAAQTPPSPNGAEAAASDSPQDEAQEASVAEAPATDEAKEQFKDMILLIADGKKLTDLRREANKDAEIQQFPLTLRSLLARGQITDELTTEGRLSVDDDGVFHLVGDA